MLANLPRPLLRLFHHAAHLWFRLARPLTICMPGGRWNPGITRGATCEHNNTVVRDGVHVHDLHATMLHLLGIDHERLTCKFQGRRHQPTDVHGTVEKDILSWPTRPAAPRSPVDRRFRRTRPAARITTRGAA